MKTIGGYLCDHFCDSVEGLAILCLAVALIVGGLLAVPLLPVGWIVHRIAKATIRKT